MNKHLIWAITIFSIVAMICGTLIWINYNSWTLRFEMDDNTKEAIKEIDFESMQPNRCEQLSNWTFACPEGYSEITLGEEQTDQIIQWAEWGPYDKFTNITYTNYSKDTLIGDSE